MSQTNPPVDDTRVIPVIEETLDVQKRQVETGGVRIIKVVHEREEVVNVPRVREEVTVERVTLNRLVDTPVSMRQEGDTLIIPLLEEVVVMEKRLMVKEELRITKHRIEEQASQQVTLRREEVVVERLDPSKQQPQTFAKESANG
jgi:uncharacterized protein (TIGR02271 family)